jgi:hypothetical protein
VKLPLYLTIYITQPYEALAIQLVTKKIKVKLRFILPVVQFCVLQDCVPVELPTQSAPPLDGGGLLHRRVLD